MNRSRSVFRSGQKPGSTWQISGAAAELSSSRAHRTKFGIFDGKDISVIHRIPPAQFASGELTLTVPKSALAIMVPNFVSDQDAGQIAGNVVKDQNLAGRGRQRSGRLMADCFGLGPKTFTVWDCGICGRKIVHRWVANSEGERLVWACQNTTPHVFDDRIISRWPAPASEWWLAWLVPFAEIFFFLILLSL